MAGHHPGRMAAADQAFLDVQSVIIRSLLAVQNVIIQDRRCFELYGYDIMFDSDLRPWLLEVNSSPSLSASDSADYDLKSRVVSDMLDIIDMDGVRTGRETRMGGFDLIWNHGPVPETEETCFLGCYRDASEKPIAEIVTRPARGQRK